MNASFQRASHVISENRSLEWVRIRHSHPRGLLFSPPLIGGDLSQQIGHFRWLIRQGYDMVSFNFSGHGKSSDHFSIRASLRDTEQMLHHVAMLSDREQLPLFGIASCYGAIPLLYATHRRQLSLAGIALVNAVSRFSPAMVMISFASYYLKTLYRQNGFAGLHTALRQYADKLFPDITKGKDHFGALSRHRANMLRTIFEFLMLDPLNGVCLRQTPVLCIHVRRDPILGGHATPEDYRNRIRRVCPRVRFRCLTGDHFLSLFQVRRQATRLISSFIAGRLA